MMLCNRFGCRSRIAIICVIVATTAGGCDGCEAPEVPLVSASFSVDTFDGEWNVVAYAADEQGCEPTETDSPYEVAVTEFIDDPDGDDILKLRLCSSEDACPDEGRPGPERRLVWKPGDERAEATEYIADLVEGAPHRSICRLATIKTLVVVQNSQLEMTESHYEITIPIEGDEACSPELAAEYSGQMPCQESKNLRLTRPDETAGPES